MWFRNRFFIYEDGILDYDCFFGGVDWRDKDRWV